uniref:Calponin-homology (CH) domain-containing protein n=1 Tax=Peronospora matthiolae TaxID=2874970 RepID=A0AAV1U266_9STRA
MSYQVSSGFLQKFSPKEIHELKRVFKEHDHDYAAAVPVTALHTVLLQLGENVTPAQTTVLLQQLKRTRPDQVTFQEFLDLLHDFRNGAIVLDPMLLEDSKVAGTIPLADQVAGISLGPAGGTIAKSPLADKTDGRCSANHKTVPWQPNQTSEVQSPFKQKTLWPPGKNTDTTYVTTPVQSSSQWPLGTAAERDRSNGSGPAATWGYTPSSASQIGPSAAVLPQSKPQWPPAGANDSTVVKPPSTIATVSKWPPVGGDQKSPVKSQWPPAGGNSPRWPPVSAPGNGRAESWKAKPSTSTGGDASAVETPERAQWPPTPPPGGLAPRTPPCSPMRQVTPVTTPKDQQFSKSVDVHTLNVLQRRASAAAQYNSTIHEVKGTAGGVHSYSEEETVAFTEHINNTLQADKDVASIMPISVDAGLFSAVCDGVVLCKLINKAVPETIDERALNFVKPAKELNVYQKTENQNLCINAAKSIGCSVVNIGPDDLIEGKHILVLGLVWQIIKIQLTSTINLKNHPELMRLLLDGETLEAFMKLPPDLILLRWMNYHLKAAGHPKKVTNFSTDMQDATAYSVLLHHIAPQHCDLCKESIPEERAAHVIQNARRLEVETFIKPRDITSGNPKLNMSFVAQLFNTCPALDVVEEEIKQLEEILYDDVGDTREERVFRMWINSLAIDDVYVNHLYSDLSDGMKLLKVLDKIQKGIVAWNRVNMVAPNKFKQVENCNYCVVLGKQLKFSLVNVGGADIFEGAKKMILSIVWQSMRYQQLKMLGALAAGRGEITDKDIISWANEKVRQSGRAKGNIVSFRDPSLSDGVYLLDLVHVVEPRAVNWDLVSQELTDDSKASNAKYAISCAQKIGATVFLTYEDIVEVKPKMVMTFFASLMLVDHQRA